MQINTPFTIKQVMPSLAVCYYPAAAINIVVKDGLPVMLEFDAGDGSGKRCAIEHGTIYIMNVAGKTIDTIHLCDVLPDQGGMMSGGVAQCSEAQAA